MGQFKSRGSPKLTHNAGKGICVNLSVFDPIYALEPRADLHF